MDLDRATSGERGLASLQCSICGLRAQFKASHHFRPVIVDAVDRPLPDVPHMYRAAHRLPCLDARYFY